MDDMQMEQLVVRLLNLAVGGGKHAINAREYYNLINKHVDGKMRNFPTWHNEMMARTKAVEGVGYVTFTPACNELENEGGEALEAEAKTLMPETGHKENTGLTRTKPFWEYSPKRRVEIAYSEDLFREICMIDTSDWGKLVRTRYIEELDRYKLSEQLGLPVEFDEEAAYERMVELAKAKKQALIACQEQRRIAVAACDVIQVLEEIVSTEHDSSRDVRKIAAAFERNKGTFGLREAAAFLGVPERQFVSCCVLKDVVYHTKGKKPKMKPYADTLKDGHMVIHHIPSDDGTTTYKQPRWTAAGLLWTRRRIEKAGLMDFPYPQGADGRNFQAPGSAGQLCLPPAGTVLPVNGQDGPPGE